MAWRVTGRQGGALVCMDWWVTGHQGGALVCMAWRVTGRQVELRDVSVIMVGDERERPIGGEGRAARVSEPNWCMPTTT